MWDKLPGDVLSHIYSLLPPDSLARAITTCKHWHSASTPNCTTTFSSSWFLAMPSRNSNDCNCYAYNPCLRRWYSLPLPDSTQLRLLAPVATLLLFRRLLHSSPSLLLLLLCNPFTRRFRLLPDLAAPFRSSPAIGVVLLLDHHFQIYVAGGACPGGPAYERTLEVYDSRDDCWRPAAPVPPEFAVRLTVWTPNDGVHAAADGDGDGVGVLYWMTSARAYSVVGYDVGRGTWREVKVPMADRLHWAALFKTRNGRLGLVGGGGVTAADGRSKGGGWMWELGAGDEWKAVAVLPWVPEGISSTKYYSVGSGDGIVYYLFRDLASQILVWRELELELELKADDDDDDDDDGCEAKTMPEWCCSVVPITLPLKAVLFHPTLSSSPFLLSKHFMYSPVAVGAPWTPAYIHPT